MIRQPPPPKATRLRGLFAAQKKPGTLRFRALLHKYGVNQRLLNLRGADDVLLIFQSLRFRIEIITQNRKFCNPFDKIAALVTKINYVPCLQLSSFYISYLEAYLHLRRDFFLQPLQCYFFSLLNSHFNCLLCIFQQLLGLLAKGKGCLNF